MGTWSAAGHSHGVDVHRAGGVAHTDEGHHQSPGKIEARSRKAPEGAAEAVCSLQLYSSPTPETTRLIP